jgi:hypothetical protein
MAVQGGFVRMGPSVRGREDINNIGRGSRGNYRCHRKWGDGRIGNKG